MGLILNPEVKLRRDKKRVLIYTLDNFTEQPGEVFFIHPAYAVLLTMFDGQKEYLTVLEEFCGMIEQKMNKESVELIEDQLNLIKNKLKLDKLLLDGSRLINSSGYNPEDFIIPVKEVELAPNNPRIDFPLIINLNLTSRCKFECRYCYHPLEKIDEDLSLERMGELFDECKEKGCQFILLSGGDPFKRKDILEIIEMLEERGLTYFISTKSYLDKKLCQRLKEVGLLKIQLSLDTSNPEQADWLTGSKPGFLNKTLETIDNLNQVGIRVGIRTVLTGYNIDNLSDFLDFCSNLEIERVQLVQYMRSIWRHEEGLFPTEEQLEKANLVIAKYKDKLDRPIIEGGNLSVDQIDNGQGKELFDKRSVCDTCRKSITILPNGEIIICEQLPYHSETILGDLKEESIQEFWNSNRACQFITPPGRTKYKKDSPCRSCDKDDYQNCHQHYGICIKDSYQYFGDFKSPDIRCQYVKTNNFRLK